MKNFEINNITIGFVLLAIAIAGFGIYSFGPVSKDELKHEKTELSWVEANRSGRSTTSVTFFSEDGVKFYFNTTNLSKFHGTSELAEILKEYKGKELDVYYTDRVELMPMSIAYFWGCTRVVAIEYEGTEIISVQDYNTANTLLLIGVIICAFIVAMIGLFPYIIIFIIYIRVFFEKKR